MPRYIEQAPGGEKVTPDGEERLPITDTTTDWWIRIKNLAAGIEHSLGSWKYKIIPSVSSNNLTVALTHTDGTNPSPSWPIKFQVGDTIYSLTATTSFTKNAGTNWCNMGGSEIATKDVDLFLYAIGETGAAAGLKFGFSRYPGADVMGDFVNTSTDEKYIAGNWTNFNATDPVAVIGRFRARLSAGAGYTWSIPTAKVINFPILETDYLEWTPAYSASGAMTYTTVTTNLAFYRLIYRTLYVWVDAIGTTGGTANNTLYATAPFNGVNTGASELLTCTIADTIAQAGHGYTLVGPPDLLAARHYDNSNWGLGANRVMRLKGTERA